MNIDLLNLQTSIKVSVGLFICRVPHTIHNYILTEKFIIIVKFQCYETINYHINSIALRWL